MAVELFPNKKIVTETYCIDDPVGKFFFQGELCRQKLGERYALDIWVENDANGEPAVIKVKMTMIKDGIEPLFNPKGSQAYIKMDYNRIRKENFSPIVNNLETISQGHRSLSKMFGGDVYMCRNNHGQMCHITKEEFDDPNYDFDAKRK